jgi:hypothetical protein
MIAERCARVLLAAALACCTAPLAALDRLPDLGELDHEYAATVRPLLATYCLRCHGESRQKGSLRLDELDHRVAEANAPTWTDARDLLDVGAMPPAGEAQPTREEQARLLAWIGRSIQRYEADHLETQGDVLLRRVNLRAWQTMVGTLTGIRPDVAAFQQDGTLQRFDTVGSAIYLTQDELAQFFDHAQRAIAEAQAARADHPRTVSLVRNLKQVRQGQAHAEVVALGKFLSEHGDAAGFATIRDARDATAFVKEAIERVVDPAICATYGKKKLSEVEAAGIDWRHDAQCMQAVLERLRGAADRFTRRVDTIAEFQPAGVLGGAGDDFMFDRMQVDAPGIYRISATMRTYEAGRPLPMKFSADGRTIATFLVDAPPDAPRAYTATVHLDRGEHQLALASTLPVGNEGYEMSVYNGYIRAHFGKTARFSFRNGHTFQEDPAAFGPGELLGYGWRKPESLLVTVSELRAEGPLAAATEPTALDEALAGAATADATAEEAGRRILAFMRRAYAGGCGAGDAKPYEDVVMGHFARNKDFTASLAYGLAAVMSSPRFLYLDETQREDAGGRRPLTGRELARRLAYFLWSDLPDAELVAAAESGALGDAGTLAAQARRLLKDPRSAAFREAFTTQWLRIDRLESVVIPYDLFPGYDPSLLDSAKRESVAFFSEVLDHDLDVMSFVDSDFVVVNDRLADHYGIPGVTGGEFRRVTLPPGTHRGGVLGQASVLIATSNGMTPSLVRRGAFIMEQLLGMPPGVPPPNVPALNKIDADGPDGQPLPQRDRLAQHRAIASCARCHDKIDPLGVGLENFDATGAWYDQLRLPKTVKDGRQLWFPHAADVSGRLPDGEAFDGADQLRACLARQPRRFLRRLAENLMIYALGRDLQQSDGPALDAICERVAKSGDGLATLIEQLVLSEQFRDK